tara:strand:- start:1844 stop:2542 length:699 start_codon:yes stop_codon:yes gene_type:complete
MHILLTRPIDDCKDLINKFRLSKFKVSHLPLIEVFKKEYEKKDYKIYNAIIFTSANAIKNLDFENIDKSIKCFCVGSVTENIARKSGFQNLYAADGNVNNLKELIIRIIEDKKIRILYVSGEITSQNLDNELIKIGYNVDRLINYSVKHVENFDKNFIEDLKKNIPNVIYIYSANSAKSFINISKKYGLNDYWLNTNLMCIGEKTSSILNIIKWKKIFLFNPGEEEYFLYKI